MIVQSSLSSFIKIIAASSGVLLTASHCLAAITTFSDRALWSSALGASQFIAEGFESSNVGSISGEPFGSGLHVSSTHLIAEVSNTPDTGWNLVNTTAGGSNFLHFGDGTKSTGGDVAYSTFTLPTLSRAFGFDIGGMQFPPLILSLFNNGGLVESFELPAVSHSVNFTGFTSEVDFNRVVVTFANGSDDFAMDEISWSVPSPGALALALLSGVVGRHRRRRD